MRQGAAGPQLQLPSLAPWMRNLLVGLFVLYVVELLAANAGLPVGALAWQPFGSGFEPWQPLTRFFVQGRSVFGVLLGLLVLYFLLPAVDAVLTRAQLGRALLAGAVGGTALPLLLDLFLVDGPGIHGWTVLATSLVLLFGLAVPGGVVNLWFVIPITGRIIVWGSLGLSVVLFLLDPSLRTTEGIGTWLGVYGWWELFGPGGRKRHLRRKARDIQRELRRFEIIEGGRSDRPQGDQRDGDDQVH